MRKRTHVCTLVVFTATVMLLFLAACGQTGLEKFVEEKTGYRVSESEGVNGGIVVTMDGLSEGAEAEDLLQYMAKLILLTVRNYPRRAYEYPADITVRLTTAKTHRLVMEVQISWDHLNETDWEKVSYDSLTNAVDYYYCDETFFDE